MRQQRIQESAASIAAATPPSMVLGGALHAVPINQAAAQAAARRMNLAARERLDKAAQLRAASAAAKTQAREDAQTAQARARDFNAARAAAEAAAAAERLRAAWADGATALQDALGVLCANADVQQRQQAVSQLLAILTAIRDQPDQARRRQLNMQSRSFPNAHGSLAVLHALGFEFSDESQRLVLADGYNRAALAAAVGQLETLRRQLAPPQW